MRLQTSEKSQSSGPLQALTKTVRHEGVLALYKGVSDRASNHLGSTDFHEGEPAAHWMDVHGFAAHGINGILQEIAKRERLQ